MLTRASSSRPSGVQGQRKYKPEERSNRSAQSGFKCKPLQEQHLWLRRRGSPGIYACCSSAGRSTARLQAQSGGLAARLGGQLRLRAHRAMDLGLPAAEGKIHPRGHVACLTIGSYYPKCCYLQQGAS